jgi:hypothetical protein
MSGFGLRRMTLPDISVVLCGESNLLPITMSRSLKSALKALEAAIKSNGPKDILSIVEELKDSSQKPVSGFLLFHERVFHSHSVAFQLKTRPETR